MSDVPHRATPEQWRHAEQWPHDPDASMPVFALELRDSLVAIDQRLKALEAKPFVRPHQPAPIPDMDERLRRAFREAIADGVVHPVPHGAAPAAAPAPAPTGLLVKVVADAIDNLPPLLSGTTYEIESARAAIAAVVEWLRAERWDGAAAMLEREAKR